MNFDDAYTQSIALLKADIPVALWGVPGIGKSALANLVADNFNLELIDIRLSQREPIDMAGWASKQGDTFTYLPYEEFPLEDAVPPSGKKGWLILLDEINQAQRQVLAASYQFILDRQVGKRKLHPNVRIMTAGNPAGSGGLSGALPTALVSRLAHISIEPSMVKGLVPFLGERIFGFLKENPKFMYEEPKKPNNPYPTLRTWEMVHAFEKANPSLGKQAQVEGVASIVGLTAALEYASYEDVSAQMQLLIGLGGEFPLENSQAMISYLSNHPDLFKQNISRFKGEWKVIAETALNKLETA